MITMLQHCGRSFSTRNYCISKNRQGYRQELSGDHYDAYVVR